MRGPRRKARSAVALSRDARRIFAYGALPSVRA